MQHLCVFDTREKKEHLLYRRGVSTEDFVWMTMIVYVAFFTLVFTLRGHLSEEDIAGERAALWTR